jgi:hypothetical protein
VKPEHRCVRREATVASKATQTNGRTQPTPENRGRLSRPPAVRGIGRACFGTCGELLRATRRLSPGVRNGLH